MRSRHRIWHLMLVVAVAAVSLAAAKDVLDRLSAWLSAPKIQPHLRRNFVISSTRPPSPDDRQVAPKLPSYPAEEVIHSQMIPVPRSTRGVPHEDEEPKPPKSISREP